MQYRFNAPDIGTLLRDHSRKEKNRLRTSDSDSSETLLERVAGAIQLDETDKQQLEILQNKVGLYLQMPETQEKLDRLGCVHNHKLFWFSSCYQTYESHTSS